MKKIITIEVERGEGGCMTLINADVTPEEMSAAIVGMLKTYGKVHGKETMLRLWDWAREEALQKRIDFEKLREDLKKVNENPEQSRS